MWKEKTELEKRAEISRDGNSRRLFASCLYSIVAFISLGIIIKIGYSKWNGTIAPIPWTDFYQKIPLLLGISSIVFLVTWFRNSFQKEPSTLICLSCGFSKNEFDEIECNCGKNDFKDIRTLEWIDDEPNNDKEQSAPNEKLTGWHGFVNDIKQNYEIEMKKKEQKEEKKIERQIQKYEKRIKDRDFL